MMVGKISPIMLVRIKGDLEKDSLFMRGMLNSLSWIYCERTAQAEQISSENLNTVHEEVNGNNRQL